MKHFLKRIASRLAPRWQDELKRQFFANQIRKGRFDTSEPEFALLDTLIKPGDWVIDIGANVGHYTKRCSELVGAQGRVIAIEPIPATFALLAANAQMFKHANTTLINAAASDATKMVGMTIPKFRDGLSNFYQAKITAIGEPALKVMTTAIDALHIQQRVALVKIDCEGHEAQVLRGMQALLRRDRPTMIVETKSEESLAGLAAMGYELQWLHGSPNALCTFRESPALRAGVSSGA